MQPGSGVQIMLLSVGLAQYIDFVRRTFGRYLTDDIAREILDSPEGLHLGGQHRFVTIMMTDLRGFTSMCGKMDPADVVKLLNHYLEAMTRIIMKYGGTIDEFIGDAILVVFGAPVQHDHEELRAVACAIEMLNAMEAVNKWNQDEGLPVVEMGIGTHSGDVVVGNIGSEMRAKFGIVGATINMTSRVESCTVGGQVLISEATRQRCGEALTLGSSQSLSLKGVQGTLEVHEVLAVGSPFDVRLDQAREDLAPPAHHLAFRFAVVKGKNVGELTESAVAVTLSKLGAEIRVAGTLEALSNLQLRVVGEDGSLHAGDLYAKVLRAGSEPGVFYVRWTSVPDVVQPILDRAIAPDPAVLGAPAAP